jgi:hypothetical protein
MFARWEQEAFGTRATEYLSALPQFKDSRARIIIHGNRAEARIGLAASDRERVVEKIHVPPVQISDAPVARLQRLSEPLPVYKKMRVPGLTVFYECEPSLSWCVFAQEIHPGQILVPPFSCVLTLFLGLAGLRITDELVASFCDVQRREASGRVRTEMESLLCCGPTGESSCLQSLVLCKLPGGYQGKL